jgi:hypothetical protein
VDDKYLSDAPADSTLLIRTGDTAPKDPTEAMIDFYAEVQETSHVEHSVSQSSIVGGV